MRIDVQGRPAYAIAYVFLEYGESFVCEHGGMALMSEGISAKSTMNGGVAKAFLRNKLADESFFMTRYTAEAHGAWVAVTPRYPGDIAEVEVTHDAPLVAESGSLLGHEEGLEPDVKYAGIKSMMMQEGITAIRLKGQGKALLSSYGGFQHFDLGPGDSVVVDTGHLVAWSESCEINIGLLGGAVTSMLSGEGLVARLTGPGEVYIQTRAEQELKSWLFPEREQNEGTRKRKK